CQGSVATGTTSTGSFFGPVSTSPTATATTAAMSGRPHRNNVSRLKEFPSPTQLLMLRILYQSCRPLQDWTGRWSESSLSGHEAGLGLFSRCPGDDPVHQTRDTSRAVPAHICNGNGGLEHTKALVRNPLCKAGGLSFDVL